VQAFSQKSAEVVALELEAHCPKSSLSWPNFPGGRPERPINTGAADFFGLHLCLARKSCPLGRGREEGEELEFGEKGVEVCGHFGETRKQWSARGSERDLAETDGLEFAQDVGDFAGFTRGTPRYGEAGADPIRQEAPNLLFEQPLPEKPNQVWAGDISGPAN